MAWHIPEILERVFVHLLDTIHRLGSTGVNPYSLQDLRSASLVCKAWYAPAMRIHNAVMRFTDKNKLLAVPNVSLGDCRVLSMPLYGYLYQENPSLHITGELFNARLPLFRALRGLFLTTKRRSEDFDIASLLRNNDLLNLISYTSVRSEEAEGTTEAFHTASSILHELNAVSSRTPLRYLMLSQLYCYQPSKHFESASRPFQLVSLFLDRCVMTDEHFGWLLASHQVHLRYLGLNRLQGVSRLALVNAVKSVAMQLRHLVLGLLLKQPPANMGIPGLAVLSSSSSLSRDALCGLSNLILPHCHSLKLLVVHDEELLTSSLDNLPLLEELTLSQCSAISHFIDDQMRAGIRIPSLRKLALYCDTYTNIEDAADICTARGIQLKADGYLPVYLGLNVYGQMATVITRSLTSTKAMLFGNARLSDNRSGN